MSINGTAISSYDGKDTSHSGHNSTFLSVDANSTTLSHGHIGLLSVDGNEGTTLSHNGYRSDGTDVSMTSLLFE
eukprot:UN10715